MAFHASTLPPPVVSIQIARTVPLPRDSIIGRVASSLAVETTAGVDQVVPRSVERVA